MKGRRGPVETPIEPDNVADRGMHTGLEDVAETEFLLFQWTSDIEFLTEILNDFLHHSHGLCIHHFLVSTRQVINLSLQVLSQLKS